MPDERNIAHDKKVLDEHANDELEMVGEHPAHAPQPGQKTPQEKEPDADAIDESGKPIHADETHENDAK